MNISTFPYELARRAATVLGSRLEVSVTVREHGMSVCAGSSTNAAGRCDQAESLADSGPCIDAMAQQSTRVVPLISEGGGWDAWRAQATREGFISALAVPALADADNDVAIALNLYSRSPDPWTAKLLTSADGYAQLGAGMLRLQLELAELEDTVAGLYRNMPDAIAIERAVGAIMHTNDCTEQEAQRILESGSRNRNVTRREVAETILRALVLNDEPRPDQSPGT